MGRRKIEIQPITHERNRSVTFLKRKNGLFKKAYELGVLCSVDVAVIIFEERPGHQVKLYQYCSSDVNNIVQRHLRFEGDRDTKTPADFSNHRDDGGDDEDEIEDDDNAASGSKQNAKKDKNKDVKPKLEPSHSSSNAIPIRPAQNPVVNSPIDVDSRPNSSRAQGLPMGATSNVVPILPISNDRHTSAETPRPNNFNMSGGLGGGISMPLPIPINLNMPPHKRPRHEDPIAPPPGLSFPYRLDVDLSTYPPAAHATSLSPQSHMSPQHTPQPPPPSSNSHSGMNLQFAQAANAMGLNLGMQNQNMLQNSFELPSRSMTYPISQHQQQQNQYNSSGLQGIFGQRPGGGPQSQATNMLLDLLNSAGQGPLSSFEWPVTSAPSQADVANSNDVSWLEFLASNSSPPAPASIPLSGGLPTPSSTSRTPSNSISSVSSAGRPPYGLPSASSSTDSLGPSRKRHRDDTSDTDDPESANKISLSTARISDDRSHSNNGRKG